MTDERIEIKQYESLPTHVDHKQSKSKSFVVPFEESINQFLNRAVHYRFSDYIFNSRSSTFLINVVSEADSLKQRPTVLIFDFKRKRTSKFEFSDFKKTSFVQLNFVDDPRGTVVSCLTASTPQTALLFDLHSLKIIGSKDLANARQFESLKTHPSDTHLCFLASSHLKSIHVYRINDSFMTVKVQLKFVLRRGVECIEWISDSVCVVVDSIGFNMVVLSQTSKSKYGVIRAIDSFKHMSKNDDNCRVLSVRKFDRGFMCSTEGGLIVVFRFSDDFRECEPVLDISLVWNYPVNCCFIDENSTGFLCCLDNQSALILTKTHLESSIKMNRDRIRTGVNPNYSRPNDAGNNKKCQVEVELKEEGIRKLEVIESRRSNGDMIEAKENCFRKSDDSRFGQIKDCLTDNSKAKSLFVGPHQSANQDENKSNRLGINNRQSGHNHTHTLNNGCRKYLKFEFKGTAQQQSRGRTSTVNTEEMTSDTNRTTKNHSLPHAIDSVHPISPNPMQQPSTPDAQQILSPTSTNEVQCYGKMEDTEIESKGPGLPRREPNKTFDSHTRNTDIENRQTSILKSQNTQRRADNQSTGTFESRVSLRTKLAKESDQKTSACVTIDLTDNGCGRISNDCITSTSTGDYHLNSMTCFESGRIELVNPLCELRHHRHYVLSETVKAVRMHPVGLHVVVGFESRLCTFGLACSELHRMSDNQSIKQCSSIEFFRHSDRIAVVHFDEKTTQSVVSVLNFATLERLFTTPPCQFNSPLVGVCCGIDSFGFWSVSSDCRVWDWSLIRNKKREVFFDKTQSIVSFQSVFMTDKMLSEEVEVFVALTESQQEDQCLLIIRREERGRIKLNSHREGAREHKTDQMDSNRGCFLQRGRDRLNSNGDDPVSEVRLHSKEKERRPTGLVHGTTLDQSGVDEWRDDCKTQLLKLGKMTEFGGTFKYTSVRAVVHQSEFKGLVLGTSAGRICYFDSLFLSLKPKWSIPSLSSCPIRDISLTSLGLLTVRHSNGSLGVFEIDWHDNGGRINPVENVFCHITKSVPSDSPIDSRSKCNPTQLDSGNRNQRKHGEASHPIDHSSPSPNDTNSPSTSRSTIQQMLLVLPNQMANIEEKKGKLRMKMIKKQTEFDIEKEMMVREYEAKIGAMKCTYEATINDQRDEIVSLKSIVSRSESVHKQIIEDIERKYSQGTTEIERMYELKIAKMIEKSEWEKSEFVKSKMTYLGEIDKVRNSSADELRSERGRLESLRSQMQSEIEGLKRTIESLRREKSSEKENIIRDNQSLMIAFNNSYLESQNKIENKLKSLNRENKRLVDQIHKITENHALVDQNQFLLTEREKSLRESVDRLQLELEESKSLQETLHSTISQKDEVVKTLNLKMKEMTHKLLSNEKKQILLEREVEDKIETIVRLKTEIANKRENLESLSREFEAKSSSVVSKNDQIKGLEARVRALENEVREKRTLVVEIATKFELLVEENDDKKWRECVLDLFEFLSKNRVSFLRGTELVHSSREKLSSQSIADQFHLAHQRIASLHDKNEQTKSVWFGRLTAKMEENVVLMYDLNQLKRRFHKEKVCNKQLTIDNNRANIELNTAKRVLKESEMGSGRSLFSGINKEDSLVPNDEKTHRDQLLLPKIESKKMIFGDKH